MDNDGGSSPPRHPLGGIKSAHKTEGPQKSSTYLFNQIRFRYLSIRCPVRGRSMFICYPAVAGAQCEAVGLLLVGRHSHRPVVTSFCLIIKKRMHKQSGALTKSGLSLPWMEEKRVFRLNNPPPYASDIEIVVFQAPDLFKFSRLANSS